MKSKSIFFIFLLILGFIYRLILTWEGNFIFNMDNARDMLDVREMVVLQMPRLIGPTSGLEGIYNGPFWYYLLSVPFIISSGHPYAEVILMIVLWFLGGLFLIKLMEKYGFLITLLAITLWISSNYVMLANLYSFNPNPVILLTPVLIFLLERSLSKNSLITTVLAGFLGGLFFNLEMAFGLFVPLIMLAAAGIINKSYLRKKNFYLGLGVFFITVLPQILFYLKNWSLLLNSLSILLSEGSSRGIIINPLIRFLKIEELYLATLSGTMMNAIFLKFLIVGVILFLTGGLILKKDFRKDKILVISLLFILVPFLVSIITPLNFMPWHLGGQMAASIILLGIFLKYLYGWSNFGRVTSLVITILIIGYAVNNLELDKNLFKSKISSDPAVFVNEIAAIDYVYQKANSQNFKVYTYLPSVYDYPYQYLFWWYGQKNYGYLPKDYAYLPDKPAYIRNKEKFRSGNQPLDSNLVFLIKQPDQDGQRHLWENSFSDLLLLSTTKIGPIEIDIREESK